MTPILFTVVLLGVLLALFNMNFRESLINFGERIPIVRNWIPDSASKVASTETDDSEISAEEEEQKQRESTEATLKQLKEQVAEQEAQLAEANKQVSEQATKAQELEQQLEAEKEQQTAVEQSEAQAAYQREVKKLAQLYAGMSPSKAAAIFDKLTTEEAIQMLSVMNNESKAAILEKMDAQKAADISIMLKDVNSSEDLAIAALQSRLKKEAAEEAGSTPSASTGLTDTQLSQTFSSLPAESAAKLIVQTYKISPDKALRILKAVGDSTRSSILEEMMKADEQLSVKIMNQLVTK
ncbi:MotE family protein [Paenibacillus brevis]